MQSRNEFPFRWLSAAPLIVRSLVKPPIQCVKVDFKGKTPSIKSINFEKFLFAVTMNGMVAAPLQFIAHRSFAGAGKAFNQIVSNAKLLDDNKQYVRRHAVSHGCRGGAGLDPRLDVPHFAHGACLFAALDLTGRGNIAPDWPVGLLRGLGGLADGYLGGML